MSGLILFQLIVVILMVVFSAIGLYGYYKYKDKD